MDVNALMNFKDSKGTNNVVYPITKKSNVIGLEQDLSNMTSSINSATEELAGKVDKEEGKGLSANDYTDAEKSKLSGIEAGANAYIHPTTSGNKHIPAGGSSGKILGWAGDGTAQWVDDHNTEYSDATQSVHGLMSTADKTKLDGLDTALDGKADVEDLTAAQNQLNSLNDELSALSATVAGKASASDVTSLAATVGGKADTTYVNTELAKKVDKVSGKGLSANDFTDALKNKLDGIEAGANAYTHPTTSGNKHIPAGGSSGKILGWAADGTAQWVDDHNTEYSDATQSVHGLMSVADKTKLDGIASGATAVTVDSGLSSSSENPVQNKVINSALGNKVDKITGKGLSTNDFTDAYKADLDGLDNALDGKADVEDLTAAQNQLNSLNDELSALSTTVSGKASSADLTALAATVGSKADTTYVNVQLAAKANTADVNAALAVKANSSTVEVLTDRVSDAETNIAAQTARIDNIVALPEGSTQGDAELTDIRVKNDGTTAASAGDAVREQISSITHNLSNMRIEYFDPAQFQVNKYYNQPTEINDATDEEYAILYPFRVPAGTYYITNFSHYFSWFVYDGENPQQFSSILSSNIMNSEYTITFTKPATLYITIYEPYRFEARLTNKPLNFFSHYGYSEDTENLMFSKPWGRGSWNVNPEYAATNGFDKDYKYVTSFDMQFDKDVYVINPSPAKYLYYVGYILSPTTETDYNNAPYLKIPANTVFRVGVKYQDNRTIDYRAAHELVLNSISVVGAEFIPMSNSSAENITVVNVGLQRSYTKIQDAVNAIIDASETNKYVVLVDEGEYDITNDGIDFIPIKPYVFIKGANKGKTIIRFEPNEKSAAKNVFQQVGGFKGYSEVSEFTIVTNNVKGTLHLDDPSWSGEIYFHDVTSISYGTEEVFNPNHDYYHNMDASLGTINLATHIGQKIVIENVNTNGYIYTHSLPSSLTDYDNENGGEFVVKNCVCDWIGVYGNGEKVRKKAILENNKCHFIKVAFIDNFGLGFMCWHVELINNNTDFIAMQYFTEGEPNTIKSLSHLYYHKNPFTDSNIHRYVKNESGSSIGFKQFVKFTDATKRYITAATSEDYDAIATQEIGNGYTGVVQDRGNIEAYASYLSTHEVI